MEFEVSKDNFTFRCMKPPSDEKREKAREQINKLIGKTTEVSATISEPKIKYLRKWVRFCAEHK